MTNQWIQQQREIVDVVESMASLKWMGHIAYQKRMLNQQNREYYPQQDLEEGHQKGGVTELTKLQVQISGKWQ